MALREVRRSSLHISCQCVETHASHRGTPLPSDAWSLSVGHSYLFFLSGKPWHCNHTAMVRERVPNKQKPKGSVTTFNFDSPPLVSLAFGK